MSLKWDAISTQLNFLSCFFLFTNKYNWNQNQGRSKVIFTSTHTLHFLHPFKKLRIKIFMSLNFDL